MPRRPAASCAVLCLALVLAGCGGEGEEAPSPTPAAVPVPATAQRTTTPAASPSATDGATAGPAATEPSPTPAAQPESQATLSYFLVRDGGGRLWVEPVRFSYDVAEVGGAVAREALTRLLAAPEEDGLVNLVPDGTALLDVDLDGTVLTVDLSGEVAQNPGAGGEGEEAFAQSLAHTGGQFPTVEAVRLLVDGEPVEQLWGHLDWSEPIAPDAFAISPIVVGEASGRSGGTIRLSGTSNTFEATIDVVVTSDGAVVAEDFITATCGTGCRGDWSYEQGGLEPGTYQVTLTAPDPSGGEGPPPFEVTVDVRVPA